METGASLIKDMEYSKRLTLKYLQRISTSDITMVRKKQQQQQQKQDLNHFVLFFTLWKEMKTEKQKMSTLIVSYYVI